MQNSKGQEDLPRRPRLLNSELLRPIADRAMFWAGGHGEMASLVKYSPYKHEVLSSDPRDTQKKPSTAVYTVTQGEAETGESPRLQSSQLRLVSEKPCLKQESRWGLRKTLHIAGCFLIHHDAMLCKKLGKDNNQHRRQ